MFHLALGWEATTTLKFVSARGMSSLATLCRALNATMLQLSAKVFYPVVLLLLTVLGTLAPSTICRNRWHGFASVITLNSIPMRGSAAVLVELLLRSLVKRTAVRAGCAGSFCMLVLVFLAVQRPDFKLSDMLQPYLR